MHGELRPPSDDETLLYCDQDKFVLYFCGVISLIFLSFGMIGFSLQRPEFWFYLPFPILLIVYLSISYFIGIFGKSFNYLEHLLLKSDYEALHHKPSVDIFLPTCGEDPTLLRNSYKYISTLKNTYGNAQVFVLDDAKSEEVRKLAEEFQFYYFRRPTNEMKKAGNLRYAFKRTFSEFILILDADFAPRHDMLDHLLPYTSDPKVAIVQSPQFFRCNSDSWLQNGAAFIQELFYRLIQVSRNTWGASICVGTCALYRRTALEPFGGTALIEYSEDVHTGVMCLKSGWKVKYHPINLATGICPEKIQTFFSQQIRWCTGSISLVFSREFLKEPQITKMQKLNYLSGGLYYVASAVGVIFTTVPSIVMVWAYPTHVVWYSAVFSLPSFLYGTLMVAYWTKAPFGLYALEARTISFWAHLFAISDKLRGNVMDWVPTNGNAKVPHFKRFKWAFPLWVTSSYGGVVSGAVYNMGDIGNYNFYPVLFFSTFYFLLNLRIIREIFKN